MLWRKQNTGGDTSNNRVAQVARVVRAAQGDGR